MISPAHSNQARINGVGGGRPSNEEARILKVIRERARKRGTRALDVCVKFWVDSVSDVSLSWEQRNTACENLTKRFGLPPVSSAASTGDDIAGAPPKMVVHKNFAAPASYSEDVPEAVREAIDKFAREQRDRVATEGTKP